MDQINSNVSGWGLILTVFKVNNDLDLHKSFFWCEYWYELQEVVVTFKFTFFTKDLYDLIFYKFYSVVFRLLYALICGNFKNSVINTCISNEWILQW